MDHAAGSGGEQIAKLLPDVNVVKAFNTTGFENMQDPRYDEGAVTMFYAGDDDEAKRIVHTLAQDLGFDPVDVGGLAQSHMLEILASLWGSLAYGQKMGRGIGFRLMRRRLVGLDGLAADG
jgi:predicted dinucleotide-binding enzyme